MVCLVKSQKLCVGIRQVDKVTSDIRVFLAQGQLKDCQCVLMPYSNLLSRWYIAAKNFRQETKTMNQFDLAWLFAAKRSVKK